MTTNELLEAARATLAALDDTDRTFDVYSRGDRYLGQVQAWNRIEAENQAFDRWHRPVVLQEV